MDQLFWFAEPDLADKRLDQVWQRLMIQPGRAHSFWSRSLDWWCNFRYIQEPCVIHFSTQKMSQYGLGAKQALCHMITKLHDSRLVMNMWKFRGITLLTSWLWMWFVTENVLNVYGWKMTQGVNNHSLPKAWIRTGMAANKHIIQFRHAHSMEHGQSLTKTAIRHTRHHQWNYRLTGWSHGELGLSVMCCEVNLMLIRSIRSPALPLCSSFLSTPIANHSKSKLDTVPANDEIPLS